MVGLKDKYKDYFKIGAAVNPKTVKTHEKLLKTHFNCLTCENESKPSNILRNENEYYFDQVDGILKFAKDNNMAMRGHT